jgi:hypothetical protein
MVVFPESGWEMIARLRRLSISIGGAVKSVDASAACNVVVVDVDVDVDVDGIDTTGIFRFTLGEKQLPCWIFTRLLRSSTFVIIRLVKNTILDR